MIRRLIVIAAFLIAAAGLAYVLVSRSGPTPAPFAKVTRETVVDTVMTNGKAEPVEWMAVPSESSGSVIGVAVRKGQQVSRGAVIAELNNLGAKEALVAAEARIEQARAELAVAESGGRAAELADIDGSSRKARLELAAAQRDVDSLGRLVEKKAATNVELDAAKDRTEQAQAQLQALAQRRATLVAKTDRDVAQARLRDAQAAADLARKRMAQSTIHAPIEGSIYELSIRPGDFVEVGQKVAAIGQLGRMKVTVYVDEPELGRVRPGMPVAVTWDARPGREWKGKVETIPTEITAIGTRQVGEVICFVDNPGNELLPGTNVNAAVRSRAVENALAAPKECLRRENGQSGVLRLEGDRLVWRPVKTGIASITRAEILEGLREGDLLLLPTDKPLKSGDRVQPAAAR